MAADDRLAHRGILVSRGIAPIALAACALPFHLERQTGKAWEQLTRDNEGDALMIRASSALIAQLRIGGS